jgi:hypothetical protein
MCAFAHSIMCARQWSLLLGRFERAQGTGRITFMVAGVVALSTCRIVVYYSYDNRNKTVTAVIEILLNR